MTPLEKYNLLQKKKFQDYVERYADDPRLDWGWVSRIPLIDIDFIQKWKHKRWSEFWLSSNRCISKQDKIKLGYKSNYTLLESMEDFVDFGFTDDILGINGIFSFNSPLSAFSRYNKNIMQDVERYPDFPWHWEEISANIYISEEFVMKHLKRLNKSFLCWNKAISIEFLRHTMAQVSWKKNEIVWNTNLNERNLFLIFSPQEIAKHSELSENTGISLDFILSNLHLGWNRELINFRPDIKKEHILNYPDFPWDWGVISGCSSIDKAFLKSHPKTNFEEFYKYHSGLTIDEVEHLTPDKLAENILLGTVEEKADYLRKCHAVKVIEKRLHDCYWFVDYAFCRKRLNNRYDQLFN